MDAGYTADVAKITSRGAILLGKYVVCDGFDDNREVGVITHIHKDHIGYLDRCISNYYHVLCTPPTREMLICLYGEWLERRRNLIPLPFNTTYTYKEEQITLYPTEHILGSCQALVIDEFGNSKTEGILPVKYNKTIVKYKIKNNKIVEPMVRMVLG